MTLILKGATDQTRYVVLRDSTTGAPETGYTIANLDLQYTRNRTAPVAKVDAVALAATDTAHTDNRAIEVDATSSPGLYRIDWPDAAFATGVDKVTLVVSGSGIDPAYEDIELVDFSLEGQSAADLKDFADAGYDPATNTVGANLLLVDGNGVPISIANPGALAVDVNWIEGVDPDVVLGAILADTNELQTDWVNGGRLDLLIDAIKLVTDLLNAAQSEPTGVPAANATPLTKLGIVYMAMRNRLDVIAGAKTVYDDGGAAEWKKILSDDGTTYSESEAVAP